MIGTPKNPGYLLITVVEQSATGVGVGVGIGVTVILWPKPSNDLSTVSKDATESPT